MRYDTVAWRSPFLVFLAALMLAEPAAGQTASRTPARGGTAPAVQEGPFKRGASVEGITEYTMPNGLRVLLFPDATQQSITVNITYLVGSRMEGYGETGMAHLLEHLMFKGSTGHTDIPQELTENGASPNGSTWFDRTNYFETFGAKEAKLDWALDLEADRMVNSFIAQKDLDSEMTVVRNEFEMGENDPGSVLLERVLSTAFLWQNYGHSTIGARADIENVPIGRLQAFYRKYYQPDNAILVVAGRFEPKHALEKIAAKFGPIPRPDRSGVNRIYPTYTAEPTQDGERSVTLRRVGDVQQATVVYHVPSGSAKDFAAVEVLAQILGTEPSGRLYKALVESGKASSVSAFDFQLREPGVLIASAKVREGKSLEAAGDGLITTVEGMASDPPTEEEVSRARNALLKNIDLTLHNSQRVALQLSEWASIGDWRLLFLNRDRIEKVSREDVARVAATYLKPSNRTLGRFIPTPEPDRAEIPPRPDVAAMMKDYGGKKALAEGEAFDPSPANIEARTRRFTLADGFKLALLPKRTRGGTVVASLTLRLGSEKALMGRSTAGDVAGSMLMRGTLHHTRQEIKDEFDRLRARVRVNGGATLAFVSVETTRKSLPAALRLLGEVLREPAFSPEEFKLLKEERLAALESQKSEPIPKASAEFSRHLSPWPKDHPNYTPTIEESIQRMQAATLEGAKHFYEQFYGGAAGQMAVVGDFDPEEIRALADSLFGSWKSPEPFTRIASPYRAVEPENVSIETPDKANAIFLAGMTLKLRDDDPAYPALVLGNYMLGGGFLNSRLASRIRQKEGLSYGVGSSLSAGAIDRNGAFTTFAIYAPENADKLEAAFKEEVARVLKDGYSEDETEAARKGYLDSRQVARSRDASLARTLARELYLDRTMEWDAAQEKAISELAPEQIVAAMRRFITPESITIVKAGDFAGAKEKAEQKEKATTSSEKSTGEEDGGSE